MTSAAKPSTFFPMIDVLRGFAATSVIVYHVIEHFGWTSFPTSGPLSWFRIGWMGVDLFFVISGFVIGLSAFGLVARAGPSAFRRPFMRRRLLRIVPLHYLTCAVFLVVLVPGLVSQPRFAWNLISHATFVHNLSRETHGALNGVNWSLGTEMQFYLLVAALGAWLARARWFWIALALVGAAWAYRLGAVTLVPAKGPLGPFPLFVAATQLPGMLDEFAAGLLFARLVTSPTGARWLAFGRRRPWVPALAAALVLYGSLTIYWRWASFWDFPMMVIGFRTLLALSAVLVVAATCVIDGPITMMLTRPLRYLGVISYGLYLWHLLLIELVKRTPSVAPARALLIVLPVTALLASASWHLFEKPFVSPDGSWVARARQRIWPAKPKVSPSLQS